MPALSFPPWLPDVTARKNSFDYWSKNSRHAKRKLSPKELSLQSRLLYHQRFLMTGGCCGSFQAFGGLCDQLNLVAIVLNLCVAESMGLGLTYFKTPSSLLEASARMGIIAPNEFPSLLGSEQLGVKEQARRGLPLSFRSAPHKGFPHQTPYHLAQVGYRAPTRQRDKNRHPQFKSGNPPNRRARNAFDANAPSTRAQRP